MGRHSAYQSPWWSSARHRGPGSLERFVQRGRHQFVLTTAAAMLVVLILGTTPTFQENLIR
jgi:hypothetical protein